MINSVEKSFIILALCCVLSFLSASGSVYVCQMNSLASLEIAESVVVMWQAVRSEAMWLLTKPSRVVLLLRLMVRLTQLGIC